MRSMILQAPKQPLVESKSDDPSPAPHEVLLQVRACGVCRTDLHVVDGELSQPKDRLIPGHQVVGIVVGAGSAVGRYKIGDRVGVTWLGGTCGTCKYCRSGRENLCDNAIFTGYTRDGGYSDITVANEDFCLRIPPAYEDAEAAPLLCAGLIGYRSLVMAGDAQRLGIYGFGAAAHIVAQVAIYQGRSVYAFTRPGDEAAQRFARDLGAAWVGDSTAQPPVELDAAIIFAPAGQLVPQALGSLAKGGVVVCGGIHMSDIPSFPYRLLWGERVVRSVANLTRADGEEFLAIAHRVPIRPRIRTYALADANRAIDDLRSGKIEGSAVLVP